MSAIGDVTVLNSLQDVGVNLFYKLANLYDSKISEYYPTKMFMRRIIEKLGQVQCVVIVGLDFLCFSIFFYVAIYRPYRINFHES